MLLRRFLNVHVHRPRTRTSASARRYFVSNRLRVGEPTSLPQPEDASTSTNTTATEADSGQTHEHFNRTEILDAGFQSTSALQESNCVTRELGQNHHLDTQNLKQVLDSGNAGHIEDAAKDLLRSCLEKQVFAQIWAPFLQERILRCLSLPTLAAILSSINPHKDRLTVPIITYLMRRDLPLEQTEDVVFFLSSLQPHLFRYVKDLPFAPSHSVSYEPPSIVRTSFIFLHRFFCVNRDRHQEKAVQIFHCLASKGHIPSTAVVDSSSSQTLDQIISLSLVKASLHWGWNDIAEITLTSILESSLTPDSFIIRHATDCLYTLVSSASRNGLHRCLNIMRLLHPHSPLPDSLVRQFYESAVVADVMNVAEEFYDFSRNSSVLSTHYYPAPQGRALSKLMSHLAGESQKIHLVRTLASDVGKDNLAVPLNDRAQFIKVIAEKGIASSARTIWELYANGKDGSTVYGDSGLMVRMASLFTNLARRYTAQESLDPSKPERVSDLLLFAHHVVSKFRQHHEPWETADHRAMTSYARACFIIGKNAEGFDIFKALLKRLELPDLHDINIALGAIAKQAPEAASLLIEKMETRGVVPDAVSLGTVLHYASVHMCTDVVMDMIERLLQVETLYSNTSAFGAVIRAVVQPHKNDTPEIRLLKLRSAWKLVLQFTDGGGTSTQLGNYLVSLAIEAQSASLAFKFWRVLLKESAEYDDAQQRAQRGAIILLARAQNKRNKIRGLHVRTIVNELNRINT